MHSHSALLTFPLSLSLSFHILIYTQPPPSPFWANVCGLFSNFSHYFRLSLAIYLLSLTAAVPLSLFSPSLITDSSALGGAEEVSIRDGLLPELDIDLTVLNGSGPVQLNYAPAASYLWLPWLREHASSSLTFILIPPLWGLTWQITQDLVCLVSPGPRFAMMAHTYWRD